MGPARPARRLDRIYHEGQPVDWYVRDSLEHPPHLRIDFLDLSPHWTRDNASASQFDIAVESLLNRRS